MKSFGIFIELYFETNVSYRGSEDWLNVWTRWLPNSAFPLPGGDQKKSVKLCLKSGPNCPPMRLVSGVVFIIYRDFAWPSATSYEILVAVVSNYIPYIFQYNSFFDNRSRLINLMDKYSSIQFPLVYIYFF